MLTLQVKNEAFSQIKEQKKIFKQPIEFKPLYYAYWNPYRKKLDNKNSRDFFISAPYFEVLKNKQGKIKTVVKYSSKNKKIDSWHLVWNRKGTRSEYQIKFHQTVFLIRFRRCF